MSTPAYGPVLIYGAGAVGQFIGGTLALAGRDVTFLARPTLRDALARSPLTITADQPVLGKPRPNAIAIPTIGAIDELLRPPALVILAVKGYDTVGALPDLGRLVAAGATVLTVQNGVGHEETLREALGAANVRSGALTINVSVAAPGQVMRHTQKGGLGLAPVGRGAIAPLPELFGPTLLPIVTAQTHRVLKWSKMLLNILGNAQAALLDCSSGELYADPRLFAIERRAFHEARTVMRAAGIGLIDLPAYPVRALSVAMALPAPVARRVLAGRLTRGRGSKAPSLALDLHSARGKTEIAWYNGAIAALGERHGVPTPVNSTLTRLVTAAATDPAVWARYRGQPGRLLAELG
ncbi:MAG TPA: 2-dehydropantoate 2-reductase [Thermomicrobiales bacterium]